MCPAAAEPAFPIVDLGAADAPERFVASLRHTGFAALRGGPIPSLQLRKVTDDWRAFFHSPAKAAYRWDPQRQDGWFPPEVSETAKGHAVKDLKEFFHLYEDGRWPAEVGNATRTYAAAARDLAAMLLGWVEAHSPADLRSSWSEPLPKMIAGSRRIRSRSAQLKGPPSNGIEMTCTLPSASALSPGER